MLETILGSKVRESVLIYLIGRERGYPREIAAFYKYSLSPVQNQLDRLESGNVLVSFLSGKTRLYSFNPRYPFLKELKALLNQTLLFLPVDEHDKLLKSRRRPRRRLKPQ